MPAPADPFYVFHRIKGELMRLMYLSNMRATTEKFMEVIDIQLPRYTEAHQRYINIAQQALIKQPKPPKLTEKERHAFSVGFANYMRNHPREESEHDAHMLRGWDMAQAKNPNLHMQEQTT